MPLHLSCPPESFLSLSSASLGQNILCIVAFFILAAVSKKFKKLWFANITPSTVLCGSYVYRTCIVVGILSHQTWLAPVQPYVIGLQTHSMWRACVCPHSGVFWHPRVNSKDTKGWHYFIYILSTYHMVRCWMGSDELPCDCSLFRSSPQKY